MKKKLIELSEEEKEKICSKHKRCGTCRLFTDVGWSSCLYAVFLDIKEMEIEID